MAKRPFNGSPTVDGYYTTFDSSEVHRIEEPSDEGGGGSSDFSTAQVTVITTISAVDLVQCMCCIESGEIGEGSLPAICDINGSYGTQDASTTKTYNVPLYKGGCIWTITSTNVSISGNIVNVFGPAYYITGNCTITIS